MAKSKRSVPAKAAPKEEGFAEKVGHVLGEAIGAVKEKFNEIVHPSEAAASKRTAAKQNAGGRKKVGATPAPKKAVKSTAVKKTAKMAPKPAVKKIPASGSAKDTARTPKPAPKKAAKRK